jgi:hypothetical protein
MYFIYASCTITTAQWASIATIATFQASTSTFPNTTGQAMPSAFELTMEKSITS